jgi:hypothetical protein
MSAETIKSRNDLFPGMEIPKPPRASFIYDIFGELVYTCPHCKAVVTLDDCDCMGAEWDCVFCANCGKEFET